MEIRTYRTETGQCPFQDWFLRQDRTVRRRIVVAVNRMAQGNLSNTKSVGSGVMEYRIDSGPGYRIYFAREGEVLIIVLAGGDKHRQQRDIEAASGYWNDYKRRRRS